MANTIRIKRSTGSSAPTTLENAELAFSEGNQVLYIGIGTGGSGGSATTINAIGGKGKFFDTDTTRTTNHYTITIKTSSGTGVAMPVGSTMLVIVDGTNVITGITQKGYVTTTGAYTAVNGDQVIVDTSAAAVTVTLPASPAVGNEVHFLDGKLSFNSNNLTIARNSQPIQGSASDLTVNTNGQSFTLVYANSTKGWVKKHFAGT